MKAELIAVGTEILTGQITNTNAQFLSEKLAELGIDVYFHTAVGDNENRLLSVLDQASQRSDLVILCGGLGPTEDDLTKQTLAKFLGKELVFDEEASKKLDSFFATRPKHTRTPNNERQAQIVEGSVPLQNLTGLAVGGIITAQGVTYVVLPGPPSELKPMVNQELIPALTENHTTLYSRVLRFFGVGESQLVTILKDAKVGEVTLRLSTKASSQEEADRKLDVLEEQIRSTKTLDGKSLSDLIYGYGESNSLAYEVFYLLKKYGKTITAAESLTAGLFQASVADFSGASQVFKGGFVTYSIEEKAKMLDIPLSKLEENGVVSHFTAEKMAEGARAKTDSDYGIALTGVAGPDTLEGHQVGTVFIGIADRNQVRSIKVVIGERSRSDVRYISTLYAFNLVRQALLQEDNLI